VTGYCLKCKTTREIKDPKQVIMKNGRPATKGTCPVCGTTMYKIGKATPETKAAPAGGKK
jgi:hypothetical protein